MNKKIKKQFEDLQKEIDDLKKAVVTEELLRLREIEKKYKEAQEYISNIKLGLKNVKLIEDETGVYYLGIAYQIPTLKIPFDENGKLARNNFFRSVNMLNLLSPEDTNKITEVISNSVNKIKNN